MLEKVKEFAEAKGYRGYIRDGKLRIAYYNGSIDSEGQPNSSLAGKVWMDGEQLMMSLGTRIPIRDIRVVNSPEEVMEVIAERYPDPDLRRR